MIKLFHISLYPFECNFRKSCVSCMCAPLEASRPLGCEPPKVDIPPAARVQLYVLVNWCWNPRINFRCSLGSRFLLYTKSQISKTYKRKMVIVVMRNSTDRSHKWWCLKAKVWDSKEFFRFPLGLPIIFLPVERKDSNSTYWNCPRATINYR